MTDLPAALARFEVPPLSPGLAERIVAAATLPVRSPPRRDRRGRWRYGAGAIVAAGLLSAGAVASGMLGRAGLEIPVLSAMLAPRTAPHVDPLTVKPRPQHREPTAPKRPAPIDAVRPEPAPLVASPLASAQLEARIDRSALLADRPDLRRVLRDWRRSDAAFRATWPDAGQIGTMTPADRRALLASRPELRAALAEQRAARQAMLAANPEIAAEFAREATLRRAARAAMPPSPSSAIPRPDAAAPPATPTPDTVPPS